MKRPLILAAIVAGMVIGSKLLVENVFGLQLEPAVTSWLSTRGAGSAVLIIVLLASDVFLPVPSSVIMVLSGAAFGVLWGSIIALAGSIAGEWLGFELVRKYGRPLSSRMIGEDEYRRFNRFFERHGAAAVIVTRPLPIVMETMSVVAGLSPMRRTTFLIASLVGTGPIVVVYAYAGALSRDVGSIVPAVVILVAVAGAGWLWYRTRLDAEGTEPATRDPVRRKSA